MIYFKDSGSVLTEVKIKIGNGKSVGVSIGSGLVHA